VIGLALVEIAEDAEQGEGPQRCAHFFVGLAAHGFFQRLPALD